MPEIFVAKDYDLDLWSELNLPAFDSSTYNLQQHYSSLTVGLFSYDTYYKEQISSDFDEWLQIYDGWSIGALMKFEYYQFSTS